MLQKCKFSIPHSSHFPTCYNEVHHRYQYNLGGQQNICQHASDLSSYLRPIKMNGTLVTFYYYQVGTMNNQMFWTQLNQKRFLT